jgi:hypothetical protein
MGGGKGGAAAPAQDPGLQIMQWQMQQDSAREDRKAQADLLALQLEDKQKDRDLQEKIATNQQQPQIVYQNAPAATSDAGNVTSEQAKASGGGGVQAGRVKTLYSVPSARTRTTRQVLSGTQDTTLGNDKNTVWKQILGA